MGHFIVTLPARILLAMIFGGIGTGIVVFVINVLVMPFKKEAAVQDAIKSGRVITAKRYYNYEIKGKKRKLRTYFVLIPPEMITLYYKSSPTKAKTYDAFGKMEDGIGILFF